MVGGADHPQQYTVERTILQLGDFAAGVNRTDGWKRSVGRLFVVVFLLGPILLGVAFLLLPVLRSLL